MTYQTLLVDQGDDNVLQVTLNRPKVLNALNDLLVHELQTVLRTVPARGARCLLITAAGRAFSSGADLGSSEEDTGLEEDIGVSIDRGMNPVIETLFALPIPVVTAINGFAAGAGCSLALAGDFIFAARSAFFLEAFVNVGLIPDSGATWLLPRAVGRARAMQMMMLGERIDAATAESWGLIYRAVDDSDLMAEATAMAQRLAKGPTRALGEIRGLVRSAMDGSLTQALQNERQAQSRSGMTSDFKEGANAFRQKRPADFRGN